MIRRRVGYIALACITIGVGLLVHLRGAALGDPTRDVVGDALWAAMIAWWIGAFAPGASVWVRGAVAYAACVAVEVSQLYHAPVLDALRATPLGRLTLGSGFDPRDLAAYGAGVAAAVAFEAIVAARLRRSPARPHPTSNATLKH